MGLRGNTNVKTKAKVAQEQSISPKQYHAPKHYHDGDVELDALERLKSNILMLGDLEQRLRFMNKEIESVIGLRKKS